MPSSLRGLPIRLTVACALAAMAPAFIPPLGSAAFAQAGSVVESITFEGNERYSEETLRLSIRTKAGQVLDRALLAEDVRTLYEYFESVEPREIPSANGIRLVFRVRENPVVTEVVYLGLSDLDKAEVEKVVESSAGRPHAEFRVENDKRKIERLAKSKGFHFVQVNARAEADSGGRRVVFEVLEGPRVSVEKILFTGNDSMPAPKILDDSGAVTHESGFLGLSGGDFSEETLRQDLLAMRAFYRAEGWLDAEVTLAALEFSADRRKAYVTIRVAEGRAYTVGAVTISGIRTYPGGEAALLPAITIAPGARAREEAIFKSATAIERKYREEGFFSVVVAPVRKLRADSAALDIEFQVEEASKIRVRNLNIHGNVVTQDKVIRREIRLAPGEVLNQNEIDKSIRRLRDLAYFDRVQARAEPLAEGDDPNQRDITFEVDDTAPTGQVRFAIGATSDFGFIGELSLTKRNFDWLDWPERFGDVLSGRAFTGAGETFNLTLAPGAEQSQYGIGYTQPWLFDKPISFDWNLFLRQFSLFEYDEDTRGVGVTFGRRFTFEGREHDTNLSVSATTRVESHDVSGIGEDSAPTAFLSEGDNSLVAERFAARLQRIDSVRFPTDGWYVQASQEFGFAGDLRLSKTGFEAGRYWPVYRTEDERVHTISVTAGFAYAQPMGSSATVGPNVFDDEFVPVYESYYAGGSTTVRGFQFGGAGPHGRGSPFLGAPNVAAMKNSQLADVGRTVKSVLDNDGDPMGGRVSVTATAEYGFPIYQDILRGVVFSDAGMVRESFDSAHGLDEDVVNDIAARLAASGSPNLRRLGRSLVYDDGGAFFGDLRVAVGFGIRLRIPALGPVPIALDFGFPVQKRSGDDTQVVSFSIERRF